MAAKQRKAREWSTAQTTYFSRRTTHSPDLLVEDIWREVTVGGSLRGKASWCGAIIDTASMRTGRQGGRGSGGGGSDLRTCHGSEVVKRCHAKEVSWKGVGSMTNAAI